MSIVAPFVVTRPKNLSVGRRVAALIKPNLAGTAVEHIGTFVPVLPARGAWTQLSSIPLGAV